MNLCSLPPGSVLKKFLKTVNIQVSTSAFFKLDLCYEVLAKQAIAYNHHLKAHLGYKCCPKTSGTEDLVYGGIRTLDLVVESPVP